MTREISASRPRPSPVIDIHSHAMPLPLLVALQRRGLADLSGMDAGSISIDPAVCGLNRGAAIPFPAEQYDIEKRLRSMDAAGVSVHAVSAPPFLFASESTDDALTSAVVRQSNDALAEFVAQAPDRLVGMATLPVGLPEASEELRRCIDELGFAGATIGTYGGGAELDAPVNDALWDELSRRQILVLVHPSRVSGRTRLADYHLVQLFGYPVETGLAISRLVFGGVLDRYDLRLCLAHGGGCLPGITPRLDLGYERKSSARMMLRPPSDYLRTLLYDTAVFDDAALARLIDNVGVPNVLMGSDFPFDLADRSPLQSVRALDLTDEEEHMILGGNALRFLSRPTCRPNRLEEIPQLRQSRRTP
ncbi:amidohydrolase family protein [Nocardia rhamnosiphila]|uniref:Amidohydrolase family protein n=1 Tax=Nocardia rhamnosiphila TaxID=426716 RepID=A0ABV2WI56_9NOCA